jgi:hypothetical protein
MFSSNSSQVSSAYNYIEDVFSTYLYTGNGSTQTITNNIDLSTKGGLVWVKDRTSANDNVLVDTVRGAYNTLKSNTTDASASLTTISGFNTTGFNLGGNAISNTSSDAYVSWTLRKQPKFFDIVTFSGNGSNRTISHNLGSTPGCIFVKCTSQDTGGWQVYHSGMTSAAYSMSLNGTGAQSSLPTVWNSTAPTSTVFSVGSAATVNQSGDTYIAYLFASNAGGFGLTGTDNVISCGSFTTDGTGAATISLGYEPQWVITKRTDGVSDWQISDTMRGASLTSYGPLNANNTNAEDSGSGAFLMAPSATGASFANLGASRTFIYIAIRRGPMAVPTVGTSVFSTVISSSATGTITSGFPTDLAIELDRTTGQPNFNRMFQDRLRGAFQILGSATANAESTNASTATFDSNTGIILNSGGVYVNGFVYEQFRRAPSFFDEVCYTGTGVATTINHNLGVVPELMIVKQRNSAFARVWVVYTSAVGNTKYLVLNTNVSPVTSADVWNNTTPTSSVFSIGIDSYVNDSSTATYVAYLFATCAGVSKVGSYTGTGATQTISCGFTGGARFVLIKRTDSTGDWYVWDTARGMVSGTDPSLLLNSTAAEVNANSIYTATGGFQIVSTASGINASGGSYIFLSIA